MKRSKIIVVAACLCFAACGDDPARSVKIIGRAPAPAIRTVTVPAKSNPSARLEFCPPPSGESTGPSSLAVTGPCAFEVRTAGACESIGDDFIVALTRKAKLDASLVVYLNVEHYHGPGSYDGAQMFVAAQGAKTIYRWSSDTVQATVGRNEAFVLLPRTQLDGEPVHIDCSRLIGPSTNYQYQCDGMGEATISIDNAPEVVSGTLRCAGVKK